MPKIKTWYWNMESGFAWNPPLLRGPRRYGNGAAMKTIRKNQNLSETHHMFSGTGTDAGKLQLEPCHCELQPNTPTGWQFMRRTKMILPRSPPATLSPKQRLAWKVLNLSGSNGGWPGSWKLPAWHDDKQRKASILPTSSWKDLLRIDGLFHRKLAYWRWMIRHTAGDTAASLSKLMGYGLVDMEWSHYLMVFLLLCLYGAKNWIVHRLLLFLLKLMNQFVILLQLNLDTTLTKLGGDPSLVPLPFMSKMLTRFLPRVVGFCFKLLKIAPMAKWLIAGGSLCQDLIYAGPYHGLLGLVRPYRVLFFTLQRTIYVMQKIVGAPWPSNGETSKAPQELLPKHDGYPQVSDQQLSGPKASSSVTIEYIEQAPAAFPMHDSKIQKALPTGGKVKRHTVIASSLVDNWIFAKGWHLEIHTQKYSGIKRNISKRSKTRKN